MSITISMSSLCVCLLAFWPYVAYFVDISFSFPLTTLPTSPALSCHFSLNHNSDVFLFLDSNLHVRRQLSKGLVQSRCGEACFGVRFDKAVCITEGGSSQNGYKSGWNLLEWRVSYIDGRRLRQWRWLEYALSFPAWSAYIHVHFNVVGRYQK